MGIDIVPMSVCASWFGIYETTGSHGETWVQEFGGSEGPARCSCPGWFFSATEVYDKECKHVNNLLKEKACMHDPQWNEGNQPVLQRPVRYTTASLSDLPACPNCGGPTVVVLKAV